MPVQKALGRMPHGTVGEVYYNQLSIDAEDFIRQNQAHTAGSLLEPLEVDFELNGFQITGKIDSINAHGMTRLIYADFRTKYELSAWVTDVNYFFPSATIRIPNFTTDVDIATGRKTEWSVAERSFPACG